MHNTWELHKGIILFLCYRGAPPCHRLLARSHGRSSRCEYRTRWAKLPPGKCPSFGRTTRWRAWFSTGAEWSNAEACLAAYIRSEKLVSNNSMIGTKIDQRNQINVLIIWFRVQCSTKNFLAFIPDWQNFWWLKAMQILIGPCLLKGISWKVWTNQNLHSLRPSRVVPIWIKMVEHWTLKQMS